MYTPTPSARRSRPRPPGSITRPRSIKTSATAGPSLPHDSSTSILSFLDKPLSAQVRRRKEVARSELDRVTASPSELGDVSLDLDVKVEEAPIQRSVSAKSQSPIEPSPPPPYGQGLSRSTSRDTNLRAPTPLRQDSGTPSCQSTSIDDLPINQSHEEKLRVCRAVDAARELGIEADFTKDWPVDSENEMSGETMRAKFVELQRQLKWRDNELLLAAEVARRALQNQEQYLKAQSTYPDEPRCIRTRTSSASSTYSAGPMTTTSTTHSSTLPDPEYYTTRVDEDDFAIDDEDSLESSRPFRTIGGSDTQLPYPLHHTRVRQPKPTSASFQYTSNSVLQQELADERIQALEQALSEARESEDNQRKLAARLRKDMDKLQRDFERAEELEARRPVKKDIFPGTSGRRESGKVTWRRRETMVDKDLRASYTRARVKDKPSRGFVWGSTSFPEFPVSAGWRYRPPTCDEEDEPDLGEVRDWMRRMSVNEKSRAASPGSAGSGRSRASSYRDRLATKQEQDDGRGSIQRSQNRLTLPTERRVRKKVAEVNFLAPEAASPIRQARSPTPRLTVEAPNSPSDHSNYSAHSRRSPWPTPRGPGMDSAYPSPNPRATPEISPSRSASLSPAFASLSSRVESMRAFMSSALGSPSKSKQTRTLGSELGSEYGDRPEQSLRIIEETVLLARPSPALSSLSVDEDMDRSMYSEGYCESPAPLPPRISAALSSLALALAPYTSPHMPPPPLPPRPSYSDPVRDPDARNLFDEAFALRRIRWADTQNDDTVDADKTIANEGVVTESIFAPGISQSTRAASPIRRGKFNSPPAQSRPMHSRHGSSSGSISLAHRRRSSQLVPTFSTLAASRRFPQLGASDEDQWWEVMHDEDMEPQTIPGRVVHDIICLLALLVEIVESAVVIVFRVMVDVRYGQHTTLGMHRRAKMRRYYV